MKIPLLRLRMEVNCVVLEQTPDILTVKQLQDVLSIGRSKAYSLLHSGKLQYITIGKQIRIPKKYLLDYIVGEKSI